MKAVVQRVKRAAVSVDGEIVSSIGPGLLCLVGIRSGDGQPDLDFISRKILNARLWPSERKAWDCNVQQKGFEILCVSQFTLYGRMNGNKPDFSQAASPQPAREMYEAFIQRLQHEYEVSKVKDGIFGAMMEVELVNDGPVTFLLDSTKPTTEAGMSSQDIS